MEQAITFRPDEVIFREGEKSSDLYFVQSGKLLVCTIQGTQVKAIAHIRTGEFLGELSFFDGKPRATYVVALETSQLVKIPGNELKSALPVWYQQIGKSLTRKIRLLDKVVQDSQVRKFGTQEIQPLTIEQQRNLYKIITQASL